MMQKFARRRINVEKARARAGQRLGELLSKRKIPVLSSSTWDGRTKKTTQRCYATSERWFLPKDSPHIMAQTKKHVIVDLDGGLVAKMAIGEVSVRENESRILDTHLVLGNVIDSWTYQTRNQTLGMLGFPVCSSFIATLPPIMLLPGHSSAVATIVSENLRYNDEGHTYEIHEAQGFEFKSLANGNVLGRELSFYVQRLLNMAGQYDVLVDPHAEDATQSTWEEKGLEKTFLLRIREEHNKRFGQLVMADVEHISFEMEDAMYRLSYYPQLIWK